MTLGRKRATAGQLGQRRAARDADRASCAETAELVADVLSLPMARPKMLTAEQRTLPGLLPGRPVARLWQAAVPQPVRLLITVPLPARSPPAVGRSRGGQSSRSGWGTAEPGFWARATA